MLQHKALPPANPSEMTDTVGLPGRTVRKEGLRRPVFESCYVVLVIPMHCDERFSGNSRISEPSKLTVLTCGSSLIYKSD